MSESLYPARAQTLAAVRRWEKDHNGGGSDLFVGQNYHDDTVLGFPGACASGIKQFKRCELTGAEATPGGLGTTGDPLLR